MRKFLSLLLVVALLLPFVPVAAEAETTGITQDDIVILYTNDVHTYIDGELSYDVIAGLKAELEMVCDNVILVDAGDHVQGTAYGSMDKGETIIELMNEAGYDLATLGNHEFDYGMEGCQDIVSWADYPYISCNFYMMEDGVRTDNPLDSYQIFTCGEHEIAFVGITTPETFTKSTPSYFQDEDGNYIYGIAGGEDGEALYADVQTAIDDAKEEGATIVIGLGHLGDDPSSKPWTSEETIANVSGFDAFIDGHSHSVVQGKEVEDEDGNEVVLTQTGEYFDRIGIMVIDAETGEISTDFIELTGDETEGFGLESDFYTSDDLPMSSSVNMILTTWLADVEAELGVVIGSTDLKFDNYDAEGNRLVRKQETNTGDFAADALYYLFDDMDMDVDVAIMNGGGVRNQAVTGDISYLTCKSIHTFGNVACLQTVTGQQLLDALEWGARCVGTEEECGGFLHVSGITYKVDTLIPDTTQKDEKGIWVGGPTGEYRVHSVKVYNKTTKTWDDLDLKATYNLAGYNYTLRDLGDGFAMFDGAVNVLDYVMEDYMVLANYINGFEDGEVGATNSPLAAKYPGFKVDYSTVNGSGRIVEEAKEEYTITSNDEKVTLVGDSEYIPYDAVFNCDEVKTGDVFTKAETAIQKKLGTNAKFAVYEMTLKTATDVAITQLDGFVKVTLPVPTGITLEDGYTLVVYRLETDGSLTKCDTEVDGDKVTFATNHFSTYIIAKEAVKSSDTGDNLGLTIAISMLALASIAGLAYIGKRKMI